MKNVIVILLICVSVSAMAQTERISETKKAVPVYLIDSVKTNPLYIDYINPNGIVNIKIEKGTIYPDGAINITLKDHNEFAKLLQSPLLSLNDIAKKNILQTERSKPVLFILNGKLLTDTTNVRIPSIRITKTTVVKASETVYFKAALPNVILMSISTQPTVEMIRGTAYNY